MTVSRSVDLTIGAVLTLHYYLYFVVIRGAIDVSVPASRATVCMCTCVCMCVCVCVFGGRGGQRDFFRRLSIVPRTRVVDGSLRQTRPCRASLRRGLCLSRWRR